MDMNSRNINFVSLLEELRKIVKYNHISDHTLIAISDKNNAITDVMRIKYNKEIDVIELILDDNMLLIEAKTRGPSI